MGERISITEQISKWAAGTGTGAFVQRLAEEFAGNLVVTTSLGAEDQVLTHMFASYSPEIRLVTLDTGRLPQETYDVIERTMERYGVHITLLHPDGEELRSFTDTHGPNAFYRSTELRKECCAIRKVRPLQRELAKYDVWTTGLRRKQATSRGDLRYAEFDEYNDCVKVSPLLEWTSDDVWSYIRAHSIPYNALHDRGYPSIGCAPCTRAIRPGEDERAGRWWWEQPEQKECGIHMRNGVVRRKNGDRPG